jgi:hypothetical protein
VGWGGVIKRKIIGRRMKQCGIGIAFLCVHDMIRHDSILNVEIRSKK